MGRTARYPRRCLGRGGVEHANPVAGQEERLLAGLGGVGLFEPHAVFEREFGQLRLAPLEEHAGPELAAGHLEAPRTERIEPRDPTARRGRSGRRRSAAGGLRVERYEPVGRGGRRGLLEPHAQVLDRAGELGRLDADLVAGQHPRGPQRRESFAGRGRLLQPEPDLGGGHASEGPEPEFGPAQKRDDLLPLVRPDVQSSGPAGFERLPRLLGRLAADPARPLGPHLAQLTGGGGEVFDPPGADLVEFLPQHDLAGGLQHDRALLQVVLELLAADRDLLARGVEHHRVPLGHHAARFEVEGR